MGYAKQVTAGVSYDRYSGKVLQVFKPDANIVDSVIRLVPHELKGANQKLINNFRMPTSLEKQSSGTSPGIEAVITLSGEFHEHVEEFRGIAKQVLDHTYSLAGFPVRLQFRDAQLSSLVMHQLRSKVEAKALVNLKGRSVSVGLMLAELHKTVDTALGLASQIIGGMVAVKKKSKTVFQKLMTGSYPPKVERRLRRAAKKGDNRPRERLDAKVAGEFLRYKYGIMPTVYDIEGLLQVVDGIHDSKLLISARSQEKITTQVSAVLDRPYLPGSGRLDGTVTADMNVTLSSSIYAYVSSDGLRVLSKVGIDSATLAELAWDLTPFSFILDHVLPVAEMIQAWSAMAGLTFHTGTFSVHKELANPKLVGVKLKSSVFNENISTGNFEGNFFSLSRQVISSPPFPAPYVVNPLSLGNAATWLSLLGALRK